MSDRPTFPLSDKDTSIHFEDEGHSLIISPKDYYLSFWIYESCMSYGPNEEVGYMAISDGAPVPFSKADPMIYGELKWDGCINWATDDSCMAHGCGVRSMRDLFKVFEHLYAAAPGLMPKWDKEVAE